MKLRISSCFMKSLKQSKCHLSSTNSREELGFGARVYREIENIKVKIKDWQRMERELKEVFTT